MGAPEGVQHIVDELMVGLRVGCAGRSMHNEWRMRLHAHLMYADESMLESGPNMDMFLLQQPSWAIPQHSSNNNIMCRKMVESPC